MKKENWFDKKHNRKAQIHMTETIAVIFIFFVLVGFGLIFYSRYHKVSLQEKAEELIAKRAIDTTTKALFLPELICSDAEAEPEGNCIDMMKLPYAIEAIEKNKIDYYFDVFGYSKITLHQIYPETDPEKEWKIYDFQPSEFTSVEPTFFVVALKSNDNLGKSYGYGYLKVEVYG